VVLGVVQLVETRSQVLVVQVVVLAGLGHPGKMVQEILLRPPQAKVMQAEMVETQVVAVAVPEPLALTELQALVVPEVRVQFRLSLVLVLHTQAVVVEVDPAGAEQVVPAVVH
jgi:hypothetical protein